MNLSSQARIKIFMACLFCAVLCGTQLNNAWSHVGGQSHMLEEERDRVAALTREIADCSARHCPTESNLQRSLATHQRLLADVEPSLAESRAALSKWLFLVGLFCVGGIATLVLARGTAPRDV